MLELPALLHILQSCRQHRNLRHAKLLHAYLCEQEVEAHGVLGNHLVPVLAELGCLRDALHVFERLPWRNEISWSSLISGYATCGELQRAFHLYHGMQHSYVQPKSFTFVPLLKSCSTFQDEETGRFLHSEIVNKGLETDIHIANTLLDMYGRCHLLAEARQVLDKLPVRDAVSWNALIARYVEYGFGEAALNCFEKMQLESISPVIVTFACTLKACGMVRDLEKGQLICTEVMKKGWETDSVIGCSAIDMYGKCGSLVEAQGLFDKLSDPDAVSWTALISGYADHGLGEEALSCFEKMQAQNVPPAVATYICSLKACAITGTLEIGQRLHTEIAKRGVEADLSVINTLVDMYGKSGSMVEGQYVFHKLPVRDVVSWTTMIKGSRERHEDMAVEPNNYMFVALLKVCTRVKNVERGQALQNEIIKKGLENDDYIASAMVDMYSKCGLLPEACMVFDKLPVKHAVHWNALISGYCEQGFGEKALNCFERMQQEGVPLEDVACACSLKACIMTGALETGREIHIESAIKGLDKDLSVGTALVDMYSKYGLLSESRNIFDKFPIKDVVSWTAMIKGLGENNESEMAVYYFENMLAQGVKPNAITFTCLLAACSQASLVDKAKECFKRMKENYGIEPSLEHYACMVDLLARSGHVNEAERLIDGLQSPPSKELLTALLSASKVHGETDLGLRCFQQLIHVNLEDSAAYLLMADVYMNTGRWNDAHEIEKCRQHARVNKQLASASIEINKKANEFVLGDSQSRDYPVVLVELNSLMKGEGYMPNLDMCM